MGVTLLVSGGLQRESVTKTLATGQIHKQAQLVKLNFNEKKSEVILSYVSPKEVCPDRFPSIRFTAMTLKEDKLYLSTGTEVLIYSYPELKRIGYVSLPSFNDIHHVAPIGDKIDVVSTGLDMVVFLDKRTLEPVEYKDVLFRPLWKKFDRNIDYRKINSTRIDPTVPHDSHPNYIFELDNEPWITRCEQRDSVCLNKPHKRIAIEAERIHDGQPIGDFIYYTSVDGRIIIVDKNRRKIKEVIDLNEIEKTESPLGWCRGLCINGNRAYVGFSSLRPTSLQETIEWVKRRFSNSNLLKPLPTRIVSYDMHKKTKLSEYIFPVSQLNAIFGIVKA